LRAVQFAQRSNKTIEAAKLNFYNSKSYFILFSLKGTTLFHLLQKF
jgi:hypothetical protein